MKIAQSTCNNSVASLVVGDALAKQRRAGKGQGEVLVIGLGGGSLPIYLHEVFSFNVECVDLDETVIRLAKTHFGFQESSETPKLQVCPTTVGWYHLFRSCQERCYVSQAPLVCDGQSLARAGRMQHPNISHSGTWDWALGSFDAHLLMSLDCYSTHDTDPFCLITLQQENS